MVPDTWEVLNEWEFHGLAGAIRAGICHTLLKWQFPHTHRVTPSSCRGTMVPPSHASQVCRIDRGLEYWFWVRPPAGESSCVPFGSLINISEPWDFLFVK